MGRSSIRAAITLVASLVIALPAVSEAYMVKIVSVGTDSTGVFFKIKPNPFSCNVFKLPPCTYINDPSSPKQNCTIMHQSMLELIMEAFRSGALVSFDHKNCTISSINLGAF